MAALLNISQHMSVHAGDAAGSRQDANRLYDPDLYHLSSQQSTQLSSRLMDLVYSNPWHPLARKHLTTASAHSQATSGAVLLICDHAHEGF